MTDNQPERVEAIERKLDLLSSSVDKRFDEVTAALVEQREYTEFVFERLRREMIERLDRVERNMATRDQVERLRLGTVEHLQRFEEKFEHKFQGVEDRLDRLIEAQTRRTRRSRRATKKA